TGSPVVVGGTGPATGSCARTLSPSSTVGSVTGSRAEGPIAHPFQSENAVSVSEGCMKNVLSSRNGPGMLVTGLLFVSLKKKGLTRPPASQYDGSPSDGKNGGATGFAQVSNSKF